MDFSEGCLECCTEGDDDDNDDGPSELRTLQLPMKNNGARDSIDPRSIGEVRSFGWGRTDFSPN